MPYTPTVWVNGTTTTSAPPGTPPISADDLNHAEAGIQTAQATAEAALAAVPESVGQNLNWIIVTDAAYRGGAVGDARDVTVSIPASSHTVTGTGFTSVDNGKTIAIAGAGAAGPTVAGLILPGSGGGGGGSNIGGNGGAGGAGGLYGGGGGGGSALNGSTSGAGGSGQPGGVIVREWF